MPSRVRIALQTPYRRYVGSQVGRYLEELYTYLSTTPKLPPVSSKPTEPKSSAKISSTKPSLVVSFLGDPEYPWSDNPPKMLSSKVNLSSGSKLQFQLTHPYLPFSLPKLSETKKPNYLRYIEILQALPQEVQLNLSIFIVRDKRNLSWSLSQANLMRNLNSYNKEKKGSNPYKLSSGSNPGKKTVPSILMHYEDEEPYLEESKKLKDYKYNSASQHVPPTPTVPSEVRKRIGIWK